MNAVGRGTLLAGRYRLEERLTQSETSSLWRGTDTTLDRRVAIRLVAPRTAGEALDAARRAALIDDPRLVRLLDVAQQPSAGPDPSQTYVVSEWVDGKSLADLLVDGALPADRVRMMVGEAAEALASAAKVGLHHLALDPTSVLLTPDGAVRVHGLAVDAAARGGAQPDGKAAERVDAVGLVALCYAGLTARWPLPTVSHHTPLDTAPMVGSAAVPPSDISSGVPNDLNTLCAVTFGVGGDGPASPEELAQQLRPWATAGGPGSNRRLADDLRNAPRRPPSRFPVRLGAADATWDEPETSWDDSDASPDADVTQAEPTQPDSRQADRQADSHQADTSWETDDPQDSTPAPAATTDGPASSNPASSSPASSDTSSPATRPQPTQADSRQPASPPPAERRRSDQVTTGPQEATPAPERPTPPEQDPFNKPGGRLRTIVAGGAAARSAQEERARATDAGSPDAGSPDARSPDAGQTPTEAAGTSAAPGTGRGNAADAPRRPATDDSDRPAGTGAATAGGVSAGDGGNGGVGGAGSRTDDARATDSSGSDPRGQREGRRAGWWPLAAVAALVVVGLILAGWSLRGSGPSGSQSAAPSTSQSTTSPSASAAPNAAPPKIVTVTPFDPQGDNSENNAQADLAIDGNPDTAWRSNRYNTAAFGNLKDGLGLVVKLEQPAEVSKVSVTVRGSGGTVEIRSATGATLEGSQVVASGPAGTLEKTLDPPVKTEYLIVWFTELPQVSGANRAEVAEVSVA